MEVGKTTIFTSEDLNSNIEIHKYGELAPTKAIYPPFKF